MGRQLSHDEQIAAIAKVNPNVEVLGKIIDVNTKVLCRCKVCNNEWMGRPAELKRGAGCPKCADRRLTHEEQVAAIAKVNPNIKVLEKIVKDKTKVSCRCRVCGYKWSAAPCNLKCGRGCPKCAGVLKLTHDERVAIIAKVNNDIEILGTITGGQKKYYANAKFVIMSGRLNLAILNAAMVARYVQNAVFFPTNTANFTLWLTIWNYPRK